MKLRAYIKLTFIQLIRQLPLLLLIFAVFPLFLSGMMAYIQNDTFTPNVTVSKMEIRLIDEDRTSFSQSLMDYLNSDELQHIIAIENEAQKPQLEVIIPKGYGNGLISTKEASIKIKALEKGTGTESAILSQIIDRYNEEMSQQLLISNNIQNLELNEDNKVQLSNLINIELQKIYSTDSIRSSIVTLKKSLTAFEFYSVSMLGFMFIMLIMTMAAGVFTEKENGLYNRIISTSLSRNQYFDYTLISSFILALVLNIAYLLPYRVTGLSFQGPLPLLALIILLQSLLATTAAGMLLAFLNKKTVMIGMNIILIVQMVLGGSFFPFEKLSSNLVLKSLSNFSPDVLLNKAYKGYILFGSFDSIKYNLLSMLFISALFYIISRIKVRVRWGEQ